MSFPDSVAVEALTLCGRCCCICHKFCGTKIELHHIKQKAYGGEDTLDNCIPLCFDCHSDMGKFDPKHPKGKHYSENELRLHRDNWFNREVQPSTSQETTVYKKDEELFQKICALFSPNVCEYLSEHNFASVHLSYVFEELDRFFERHDPFNRFIREDMENLRLILEKSWLQFSNTRALNTFSERISGQEYYVTNLWILNHRSKRCYSEEEYTQVFAEFEKDAELINVSASNVWKTYNEFVRQGRRILSQ